MGRRIAVILATLLTTGCFATKPIIVGTPPRLETFIVELSRPGSQLFLHYPTGQGDWREVCVDSTGRVDDKYNPGSYTYTGYSSCWAPRFRIEPYTLPAGTFAAVVTLYTSQDAQSNPALWKPWVVKVQVRPIEGQYGIAGECDPIIDVACRE